VLEEAVKAIRAHGPHRTILSKVMANAGLTHGGFYAHFASKEDLVAAAISRMFDQQVARMRRAVDQRPPAQALAAQIDDYLSAAHRDGRISGCPIPVLASDLPRLPEAMRRRFSNGVAEIEGVFSALLAQMGDGAADCGASSLMAELAGALALARAEPEVGRSDGPVSADGVNI
jgi:TetR/AcrR family transcriptional repressor of nem operon